MKKKIAKVEKKRIYKKRKNMEEEIKVDIVSADVETTTTNIPLNSTSTAVANDELESEVEVKEVKIAPLEINLEREDLNQLVSKINEIVAYLNK